MIVLDKISALGVEAGGSEIQGHFWLRNEFRAGLGYMRVIFFFKLEWNIPFLQSLVFSYIICCLYVEDSRHPNKGFWWICLNTCNPNTPAAEGGGRQAWLHMRSCLNLEKEQEKIMGWRDGSAVKNR